MEHTYGIVETAYEPKVFSVIADSGVLYSLIYISHYRRISSTRNRINTRILTEFNANPRMEFAYPTERHIPTPETGGFPVKLPPAK